MVARLTLDQLIKVRILVSQPNQKPASLSRGGLRFTHRTDWMVDRCERRFRHHANNRQRSSAIVAARNSRGTLHLNERVFLTAFTNIKYNAQRMHPLFIVRPTAGVQYILRQRRPEKLI
jgi:hypothetical protein